MGPGNSNVDIRLVSKCLYFTLPIFLLSVVLGVYLLEFVCLFDYACVLTETVFVQFTEHDIFFTSMSV